MKLKSAFGEPGNNHSECINDVSTSTSTVKYLGCWQANHIARLNAFSNLF